MAPWYNYAMVSVSNVVATFCQYEALKYVSFPVQTLGKCAKMMPVMIWGIIIMKKRYTLKDFGIALAVTGGCTLFLLTGEVKSKVGALAATGIHTLDFGRRTQVVMLLKQGRAHNNTQMHTRTHTHTHTYVCRCGRESTLMHVCVYASVCVCVCVCVSVCVQAAKADIGGLYAVYGLALMMGYLGFDGFTSTFQVRVCVCVRVFVHVCVRARPA